MEITFAIIKPDAVINRHSGDIIRLVELNGFSILRMQKINMMQKQAETFYEVHKTKPFFGELVSYMTSGPVIVMALQKENAINDWRALMGATNPAQAAPGTIRKMFGTSIGNNAVHGSDSSDNARIELKQFFTDL